jgi:dihydrofolate reductase
MRNVILSMHISLDGFVAGPNGELDWTRADAEIDNEMPEMLRTADTVLIGRGLYQGFASYWPSYPMTDPSKAKGEIEFAKWIIQAHKVVFSRTLEKVEWSNARLVHVNDDGDIANEVAKLKQQPGKNFLLFGGVRMAQTFAQLGLIDEYRLLVQPKVLGSGKPLFTDIRNRINLKLVSAKSFKVGAVMLQYQPDRK